MPSTEQANVYFADRQDGWQTVEVEVTEVDGIPVYSLKGYRLSRALGPGLWFAAHPEDWKC